MRGRIRNRAGRRALLRAIVLCLALPVAAQAAEPALFDAISKGTWTLRLRDGGAEQRICVRDGNELVQIRHKETGCSRFVVKDSAEEVVVQYTCPGNGYGRTSVRKESNGLVQIQSQGIVNGAPFSFSGEARHSGAC